jgi:hypothetical protein
VLPGNRVIYVCTAFYCVAVIFGIYHILTQLEEILINKT